ncbi:NAD(P)H-dependent flavin oxidoreductase [Planotetraspora thailandica]|nr:nitronate monooxygenase [Planotetraspora thailandica]
MIDRAEVFGTAVPVIQAPMAGGAATPALVAAVSSAGGLGFLAAGYRTAAAVQEEITAVRGRTDAPFGVNVFVPGPASTAADEAAVARYRDELAPEALRYGVAVPEEVAWDDDGWQEKIDLLVAERVPVVSFTFGCPPAEIVARLQGAGSAVVVTVNTPSEALVAAEAGADALSVQGPDAGGHQTSFLPEESGAASYVLPELVASVREVVGLPLAAGGGITDGAGIASVLAAGAVAAQLGTAFLRTPESGAHPVYKAALADPAFAETAFTRAFTGRRARGLLNRFMIEHEAGAPSCYPLVHQLTRGLRQAAAAQGDPHGMALWAGTGYRRAREVPAADLVRTLVDETRAALG